MKTATHSLFDIVWKDKGEAMNGRYVVCLSYIVGGGITWLTNDDFKMARKLAFKHVRSDEANRVAMVWDRTADKLAAYAGSPSRDAFDWDAFKADMIDAISGF